MASSVTVCNRALQKLGARRITLITENSTNAKACNSCYTDLRDAELRSHPWSFAIKRAELAADGSPPSWGRAFSYQLPTDFLRLINTYPELNNPDLDYEIEERKILTDISAPLRIRYISKVTDENNMDVLFRESLACRIAIELCEEITQSNTKKQILFTEYRDALDRARKTNAIEKPTQPIQQTEDWLQVRN